MAEVARATVFSDIRQLIHDTWEFFAPPFIRLTISVLIFWYICGNGPLVKVWQLVETQASSLASSTVISVFEKYNFTALMPIILLFLISIFAYVGNRIIYGISALLPLNISFFSQGFITQQVWYDPIFRRRLESKKFSDPEINDFINNTIAKARIEKQESFKIESYLSRIDYLERESGRVFSSFSFAKFLLVWTIACAVLSRILADATPFTFGRLFLLLILVILFGIYSICNYASNEENLLIAKIRAARVILAADDSTPVTKDCTETHQEALEIQIQSEMPEVIRLQGERWWGLTPGLTDWWKTLKYFYYRYHFDFVFFSPYEDKNLLLQAILRNNTITCWFVFGAVLIWLLSKLSWWVGCILFIGYVSFTFVDFLLVTFLAVPIFGQAIFARLKDRLPLILIELLPMEPQKNLTTMEMKQKKYRLTLAALRIIESSIGIFLSTLLARFLF
jgi:hypothetical protein